MSGTGLLGQQRGRTWPQGMCLVPLQTTSVQFQRVVAKLPEGGIKPIAEVRTRSSRGDTRRCKAYWISS